jgi:hypothetical protein
MKTGALLESLINLAQIQKTDLAISMNMTPSGLSKILTGKRLPFFKEKRAFSRQAAGYFAEAIFCRDCYLKLKNIFPILYDFSTKYELETFLTYAIDYTLSSDFFEENGGDRDYPDRELSFLGKTTILNMFCVTISDYFMTEPETPLEFYSSLPTIDPFYSDIFSRLKFSVAENGRRISFHHLFDTPSFEASAGRSDTDILSYLSKMEQYVDLTLWQAEEKVAPFFLLKDRFLLVFSNQIDGRTPLMTFITHKSYLTLFFHSLTKKNARKISYSGDEVAKLLETDPFLITRLAGGHFDAVYNFLPIGYLSSPEEFAQMNGKEPVKKGISDLFRCAIEKSDSFFISVDSLSSFYNTGKVIVPLLGTLEIAKDLRIPYLMRYDTVIDKGALHGKVRITNNALPKMYALCAKEFSLIYLNGATRGSEKIHYFHSDIVRDILDDEVAVDSMQYVEFDHELWNSYIGGLSKGQAWI